MYICGMFRVFFSVQDSERLFSQPSLQSTRHLLYEKWEILYHWSDFSLLEMIVFYLVNSVVSYPFWQISYLVISPFIHSFIHSFIHHSFTLT